MHFRLVFLFEFLALSKYIHSSELIFPHWGNQNQLYLTICVIMSSKQLDLCSRQLTDSKENIAEFVLECLNV